MSSSTCSTLYTDKKNGEKKTIELYLPYQVPFDFIGILNFLKQRLLIGIEFIRENHYIRTLQVKEYTGYIIVSNAQDRNELVANISLSLTNVIPIVLNMINNVFDLQAQPKIINQVLIEDNKLRDLVLRNSGLRLVGSFNFFELAVRAILGQQVTVKAATTIASRFIKAFGIKVITPFDEVNTLFPEILLIAKLSIDEIRSRAQSIISLANLLLAMPLLELDCELTPTMVVNELIKIKGIGVWTANYIAMRYFKFNDIFLSTDIAILNSLDGISSKEAEEISQKWKPWRSYAVIHLWNK